MNQFRKSGGPEVSFQPRTDSYFCGSEELLHVYSAMN